jgi:hypothetical protein
MVNRRSEKVGVKKVLDSATVAGRLEFPGGVAPWLGLTGQRFTMVQRADIPAALLRGHIVLCVKSMSTINGYVAQMEKLARNRGCHVNMRASNPK